MSDFKNRPEPTPEERQRTAGLLLTFAEALESIGVEESVSVLFFLGKDRCGKNRCQFFFSVKEK
jgi:hypothetical protein